MSLNITNPRLSANVDLGRVTFALTLAVQTDNPFAGQQSVIVQTFALRGDGSYTQFNPPGTFPVQSQGDSVIHFDAALPVGVYTGLRVIVFAEGYAFLYDSNNDASVKAGVPCAFEVKTTKLRLLKPTFTIDESSIVVTSDASGKATGLDVSVTACLPVGSVYPNNLALMVKGDGFQQAYASVADFKPIADPDDPYLTLTTTLHVTDYLPSKPGSYELAGALYDATGNWTMISAWVYPGILYDFPKATDADTYAPWVIKCPDDKARAAASLVGEKGTSWGNFYGYSNAPVGWNDPTYHAELNKHFAWERCVYSPDRWLASIAYRNRISQTVEAMLYAGMAVVLSPQGLCKNGGSLADNISRSIQVIESQVKRFGTRVAHAVTSEPFEFRTWADFKPVQSQLIRAARTVNPQAFLIGTFEYYAKGSTADWAKDPPTGADIADINAFHGYLANPDDLESLLGPALAVGQSWMIEEYGSTDPAWIAQMDRAIAALSAKYPTAFSTWGVWGAIIAGQDGLAFVAGDGTQRPLTYMGAGPQILADYDNWKAGLPLGEPLSSTAPTTESGTAPTATGTTPADPGVPGTRGLTEADVTALADADFAKHLPDINAAIAAAIAVEDASLHTYVQSLIDTVNALVGTDVSQLATQIQTTQATATAAQTTANATRAQAALAVAAAAAAKSAVANVPSLAAVQQIVAAAIKPLSDKQTALETELQPIVDLLAA